MPKYDFLIVGAGFFGATFARQATDAGRTCLVVDKNPHVAGAAYDREMEGVIVSEYGAHILHTQSDEVWEFLGRFGTLLPFVNKPKVLSGGRVYSFPVNLMTLHQLWGVTTPEQARQKLNAVRVPCESPDNFEDWALDKVGREVYEKFFYGYTKKQWLREPRTLPRSVIQRLPIRLTYDENYFNTKHQGVPKDGFTKLVESLLDGSHVRLGVDFFTLDWRKYADRLVYTGPADRFFDFEYGRLDYNTLRFEHKILRGDFQGNAVFNHPDPGVPYIRSVEHRHFRPPPVPKHDTLMAARHTPTVVTYDHPVPFRDHPEPYYPVRDERNSALFARYKTLMSALPDVTFGGRLGEYKYLDMDQTVASALRKSAAALS